MSRCAARRPAPRREYPTGPFRTPPLSAFARPFGATRCDGGGGGRGAAAILLPTGTAKPGPGWAEGVRVECLKRDRREASAPARPLRRARPPGPARRPRGVLGGGFHGDGALRGRLRGEAPGGPVTASASVLKVAVRMGRGAFKGIPAEHLAQCRARSGRCGAWPPSDPGETAPSGAGAPPSQGVRISAPQPEGCVDPAPNHRSKRKVG